MHCYRKHMASALTSQLNYRSTLSCSVIVIVYFVPAHLRSSSSVHYLLWCCVQSMFSIIAAYVFLCLYISILKIILLFVYAFVSVCCVSSKMNNFEHSQCKKFVIRHCIL